MHARKNVSAARVVFIGALMLSAQCGLAQQSPHGNIRFQCSECHATDSWKMRKDASFQHQATGFALTGKHELTRCSSCHARLQFAAQSADCFSCHTDVHKSDLGKECLRCHTTQTWKIADMRQKHQQTRFPLLGRHASLHCEACHANAAHKQFAGTPNDCMSCHRHDFARTQAPNHAAAGFSTECLHCHQVTAMTWGSGFDHARTTFPLTGAHASTSCSNCHKNQVFRSTPSQCVVCHRAEYAATANPNHTSASFPTECQVCHNTTAWQGARFDHNGTQFPLTGAHLAVACTRCHVNNQYRGLPSTCVGCHLADFTTATNPNHVAGNFPTQCLTCHSQSSWHPATFDHGTTRLPLTGRHATASCIACHVNNNYTLTYQDCYQCHANDYARPTNPNHVTSQFSHDCSPCHSTAGWLPSTFNHDGQYFRIYSGKHRNRWNNDCASCHPTAGQYQVFTCTTACHPQAQTDNKHRDVQGYSYSSPACYSCHRNV